MLDRVEDADKRKKYYQIITRESERLPHLLNNVLDFASIESGKKTYELQPARLDSIVKQTVESYRLQLEEKGFEVTLDIEEGIPEIPLDPDGAAQALINRINRINLINLINNAIKYSPKNKELSVRCWKNDETLRVHVKDHGLGIDPADQKRVFEDFYRTPEAQRLGQRGTGLGLSLV